MDDKLTIISKWWSSLTVTEKERIAGKIAGKPVNYPECTSVWLETDDESKVRIFNHCVIKHGDDIKAEKAGKPYGD